MKHPEVIVVPFLMIADYVLTVLGAVLRDKRYKDHVRVEHYELNPLWQEAIARKRWISPRHLVLSFAAGLALVLLFEYGSVSDAFRDGALGCLFTVYALVIGRHVCNLLLFHHLARRPQDMTGELTMTHHLSLCQSAYQMIPALFAIAAIAWFCPRPFARGALLGVLLLLFHHAVWIVRNRRKRRAAAPPATEPPRSESPASIRTPTDAA